MKRVCCPHCYAVLSCEAHARGQIIACTRCANLLQIPPLATLPPHVTPEAPPQHSCATKDDYFRRHLLILGISAAAVLGALGLAAVAVNLPTPAGPKVAWRGTSTDLCIMDSNTLLGQWIEVHGPVRASDATPSGVEVTLGVDDGAHLVICRGLPRGTTASGTVSVRGRVTTGGVNAVFVRLDHCELVR
jgi:hypothetical protein